MTIKQIQERLLPLFARLLSVLIYFTVYRLPSRVVC